MARARMGSLGAAAFGAGFGLVLGLISGLSACSIGEEEPGCQSDEACGEGYLCRAGACFRVTTGLTPPKDPADAGDGSDEGGSGGSGGL